QEVFHDLLGDCRASLGPAGLSEIADERTDQTALVHTLVLIESFVLGSDESVAHVVRDISECHPYPSLVLLEYLREALSFAVQHHTRAGKLEPFEFAVIRQIGSRFVVEIDDIAEIGGRGRNALVLAKLSVGPVQIGEIDAAKSLVLTDRLR